MLPKKAGLKRMLEPGPGASTGTQCLYLSLSLDYFLCPLEPLRKKCIHPIPQEFIW